MLATKCSLGQKFLCWSLNSSKAILGWFNWLLAGVRWRPFFQRLNLVVSTAGVAEKRRYATLLSVPRRQRRLLLLR